VVYISIFLFSPANNNFPLFSISAHRIYPDNIVSIFVPVFVDQMIVSFAMDIKRYSFNIYNLITDEL
jgi:hypothetical protein